MSIETAPKEKKTEIKRHLGTAKVTQVIVQYNLNSYQSFCPS